VVNLTDYIEGIGEGIAEGIAAAVSQWDNLKQKREREAPFLDSIAPTMITSSA
jgi:hypothetical protein